MATEVGFQNPSTGQIKVVKLGFSWTALLFSSFFGIPLFMRGLNSAGAVMAGLAAVHLGLVVLGEEVESLMALAFILSGAILALSVYFGFNANEMTAKRLVADGWQFVNPDAPVTIEAAELWGLHRPLPDSAN